MRIKQKSKKGYKINGSFNKSKMADQKDGLFKKWMFWKKKHPLKFEFNYNLISLFHDFYNI